MTSLKIDEKWTRSLLSCMSLNQGLTPYAKRNFLEHLLEIREVPKWMQYPQPNQQINTVLPSSLYR